MPTIIHALHKFLQEGRENPQVQFLMDNSDLKGFFTSVPADRIMLAINHLVQAYYETDPSKKGFSSICFTVPQKIVSKTRIIRGKLFTKSTKNRVLYLADLVPIATLALQQSQFVCMDEVYEQTRGAIIGGQLSPVLCAIAVSFEEMIWIRAYSDITHSAFLCIRYVDKRLTFVNKKHLDNFPMRRFLHPLFYGSPVELEDCGNTKFLGYIIDVESHTMQFDVPETTFSYRSNRPAGTTGRILSGLVARLHLIHRGTFPESLIKPTIDKLLEGYRQQGFTPSELFQVTRKVAL